MIALSIIYEVFFREGIPNRASIPFAILCDLVIASTILRIFL